MDFLKRRRPDASRDRKCRERRQRGVASVEMITVLPVLLLLLFGTIDFGLLFRDWMLLGHSARVAARTATMFHNPCNQGTIRALATADGMAALAQADVDGNIDVTVRGSLMFGDRTKKPRRFKTNPRLANRLNIGSCQIYDV